ncbi:MAG: maleate cis-trans isomerase [Chloroflexi bacterium]|jgi:maleate cis-trans isomerase|nr:maleate cis-trans isomerase [Chloroflexota bacterium]
MARHGKKRLGLLTPPANTTMEDDFARWMPDSVRLHTHRLTAPDNCTNIEYLEAIAEHVGESARLLNQVPIDVMAFGCTSGSFLHGPGYDDKINSDMREATGGVSSVVTAAAVVDALKSLNVTKISACSPYIDVVNERLKEFYTHAGFDILKFAAVDRNRVTDIDDAPREVALELALSVDTPESEAIFISCTAFRGASEVIEELEQKTGKPVVTSNQATFWWCMREMGITDAIPGGGVLMGQERPVAAAVL